MVSVLSLPPAGAHHWVRATIPTEVQVHMLGPFAITYVNPADDPRAKPGKLVGTR